MASVSGGFLLRSASYGVTSKLPGYYIQSLRDYVFYRAFLTPFLLLKVYHRTSADDGAVVSDRANLLNRHAAVEADGHGPIGGFD